MLLFFACPDNVMDPIPEPPTGNGDSSNVQAGVGMITIRGNTLLREDRMTRLEVIITAVGGANQGVTWSSSHPDRAYVSQNGVITPGTTGDVVITARSVFDTNQYAEHIIRITPIPAPSSIINLAQISGFQNSVLTDGDTTETSTTFSAKDSIYNFTNNYIIGIVKVYFRREADWLLNRLKGGDPRIIIRNNTTEVGKLDVTGSVRVSDVPYVATLTLPVDTIFNQVVVRMDNHGYSAYVHEIEIFGVLDGENSVLSVNIAGDTNVILGDTDHQLTATVVVSGQDTGQTVIWKSSDTRIATVDTNGLVTGVAVGNVVITATSAFDNSKYEDFSVNVIRPAVLSVSIEGSTNVDEYATTQLAATVATTGEAAQTVTWTSSYAGIATVDTNGLVTGVAAGDVVITATSVFDNTKISTHNITVKPFHVYGYRLTVSTPNSDTSATDVILQVAEGGIHDGSSTTDLLAGVAPSTDTSAAFGGQVGKFNDGSDNQSLAQIFHSIQDGDSKMIQVLGTNRLIASSGVFRIRIIGRDSFQERGNGVVVTLLNQQGNPIGTASGSSRGFAKNNLAHDGFEVDFNAVNGAVVRQPTIFVLEDKVVQSVNITGTTVAQVGNTTQLMAIVQVTGRAEQTVTWTSSDTGVATVDANGVVTGVAVGNSTIRATSTFDSTKYGELTVTVTSDVSMPRVTSVTLNGPNDVEIGQKIQLTNTVNVIDGANMAVIYTSSRTHIATVSGTGVVTGVATGNVDINVISIFDMTKRDTHNVRVTSPTSRNIIDSAVKSGFQNSTLTDGDTTGVSTTFSARDSIYSFAEDYVGGVVKVYFRREADWLLNRLIGGNPRIVVRNNGRDLRGLNITGDGVEEANVPYVATLTLSPNEAFDQVVVRMDNHGYSAYVHEIEIFGIVTTPDTPRNIVNLAQKSGFQNGVLTDGDTKGGRTEPTGHSVYSFANDYREGIVRVYFDRDANWLRDRLRGGARIIVRNNGREVRNLAINTSGVNTRNGVPYIAELTLPANTIFNQVEVRMNSYSYQPYVNEIEIFGMLAP